MKKNGSLYALEECFNGQVKYVIINHLHFCNDYYYEKDSTTWLLEWIG